MKSTLTTLSLILLYLSAILLDTLFFVLVLSLILYIFRLSYLPVEVCFYAIFLRAFYY